MPHGTSPAQESLERALSTTTIRRELMLPEDLADHLLDPQDDVLLALPSLPGDRGRILLVTHQEVILGQWNAEGTAPTQITRKRTVPAQDVRGVSYRPGMYHDVDIDVRGRDLSLEPCTAEDAIRFAYALDALATTGRLPPPLSPAEVDTALHATGNYAQDGPVEARMRSAWDRALMGTRALWNCEEVHSGPALGWLHPGEHTYLVLVGTAGVATDYLAVTDRRVFRGSAPGRRTEDRAPAQVREAVYDSGFLSDAVRIEMHEGSPLTLKVGIRPLEGAEFVDALNTLVATGSLPPELLPFR